MTQLFVILELFCHLMVLCEKGCVESCSVTSGPDTLLYDSALNYVLMLLNANSYKIHNIEGYVRAIIIAKIVM